MPMNCAARRPQIAQIVPAATAQTIRAVRPTPQPAAPKTAKHSPPVADAASSAAISPFGIQFL